MATRQETTSSRESLEQRLRQAIWDGEMPPGSTAPSVSAIAHHYGVTRYLAHQAVVNLTREGLFYSVPNIGTFVGAHTGEQKAEFWILNDLKEHHRPLRRRMRWSGAEEALAAQGATVVLQSVDELLAELKNPKFSPENVGGIIDLASRTRRDFWGTPLVNGWQPPRVRFALSGEILDDDAPFDSVSFDDFAGGQLAARHLKSLGHRQIAFVGLHQTPFSARESWASWSCERANGWASVLDDENAVSELLFSPAPTIEGHEEYDFSALDGHFEDVAAQIAARTEISALVAANDAVASALMHNWEKSGFSRRNWPAIVSFDGDTDLGETALSMLRLPWHELSRAAADLLWGRRCGQISGEPIHRRIAIKLIPRRSCRAGWLPLPAQSHASSGFDSLSSPSQNVRATL